MDDLLALDPRIAERVRDSIARQSMLGTLGVGVQEISAGRVELTMPRTASNTQQHGFVHAGAITTLADSACGYAALTGFPTDRDVLTVDFTVNLIAPARQERFVAVGCVVRSGRTLTVSRGEVYGIEPDGARTAVALMQATMMAVTIMS